MRGSANPRSRVIHNLLLLKGSRPLAVVLFLYNRKAAPAGNRSLTKTTIQGVEVAKNDHSAPSQCAVLLS